MRARSSIGSGATPPRPAGRLTLALVAVTCASVAFALVPGRPVLAVAPAGATPPALERERGPIGDALPAGDHALDPTAEETEDETDESRADAELDALACEGVTHDWLPAWEGASVDALHTHAPPARAHVAALERPPRVA